MTEARLEKIKSQIRLASEDPGRLMALLATHETTLREAGEYKALAVAYWHAGEVKRSHKYLNLVPREALDDQELRLAATIRHHSRLTRRKRFGLYLPSDKRLSKRIVDGAANLVRYGRLRDPSSTAASIPRDLRRLGAQIRHARDTDIRQLRALLEQNEEEYGGRGYAKFLAFNFYHAGCLSKAAEYAREVDRSTLAEKEGVFLANIEFEYRALKKLREGGAPIDLETAPPRLSRKGHRPFKALYLAASSRPFILSGYTSRTEALVRAMLDSEEFALVPATRPGFPADRTDAKNLSSLDDEQLLFDQLGSHAPYRGDLEDYLSANLPMLEAFVEKHAIDVVHGVSNHRNGLIGLALARRIGLPFVYEIRGLWEETTDTKLAGWRDTERFEYERLSERYLAKNADGVLVINRQVQEALEIEDRPNVQLLPNCVSQGSIVEHGSRSDLKPLVIGYVGSILEYEGLDDLIHAVTRLQGEGREIRLDIYGKGPDEPRLRALVRDLGAKGVSFHGVVDPSKVPGLYEEFDLCVFARKDYRVCQLVTPLKPLEAMANDVNVIVSDVAPLAEFARDGSVQSFEAGNVAALAASIDRFLTLSEDERRAMRAKARSLLCESYVWEKQCGVIGRVYAAAHAQLANSREDDE